MTKITGCQYIGADADYTRLEPTCCRPTVKGRSYCEEHLYRVYQKGTAVQRKKDIRTADSVHLWESLMNEAVEELEDEGFL
jgi:hypothetical protein